MPQVIEQSLFLVFFLPAAAHGGPANNAAAKDDNQCLDGLGFCLGPDECWGEEVPDNGAECQQDSWYPYPIECCIHWGLLSRKNGAQKL